MQAKKCPGGLGRGGGGLRLILYQYCVYFGMGAGGGNYWLCLLPTLERLAVFVALVVAIFHNVPVNAAAGVKSGAGMFDYFHGADSGQCRVHVGLSFGGESPIEQRHAGYHDGAGGYELQKVHWAGSPVG
jgi:hypothetical protein